MSGELITNSYLEFSLTLLGWFINNGIWGTLTDAGIFAVPFIFMIIGNFAEMRRQGADEGNKGVLAQNNLEMDIGMAILIMMLTVVPWRTTNLQVAYYASATNQQLAQCAMSNKATEDTSNRWSAAFSSINGSSAALPLWWEMWHVLTEAFTSSAVATIPCEVSFRQVRYELDHDSISDPALAMEVQEFVQDCYAASKARLTGINRNDIRSMTDEQLKDTDWIGSN